MLLDFDGSIWLIGLALLTIVLVILWQRQYSLPYLSCCFLFGVYLLFVAKVTLFPIPLSGEMIDVLRAQMPFMSGVNLIPMHLGAFTDMAEAWRGLLLNIVLTLPFGFGINFIVQNRVRNILLLAIMVGATIEGLQLAISLVLGFPYRTLDVNDLLCNAAGVLIGYGIFRVFAWLYVVLTQRFGVAYRGFTAYIYNVALKSQLF